MNMTRIGIAVVLAAVVSRADVKLPAVIGDNMVLQQGKELPIWGRAAPGEGVTVTLAGQAQSATTDATGNWRVCFQPLPATAAALEMTVKGQNTLTVKNILVGEVWACSGQSNMQWEMYRVKDAATEAANAEHPQIRMFSVARNAAMEPQSDCTGAWVVCSPKSVGTFSAIGYCFARDLHQALGVPVGMLNTSYTGSAGEAWVDRATLTADPRLKPIIDGLDAGLNRFSQQFYQQHGDKLRRWLETAGQAVAAGKPAPVPPVTSTEFNGDPRGSYGFASGFFNGMVAPLAPYALAGALWYQGESNVGRAPQYRALLPALITSWRNAWGQGDFAFLVVQLPNYNKTAAEPGDSALAEFREAQLAALTCPNTAVTVNIDLGDGDLHPLNKQDFSRRLALAAQGLAYKKDIAWRYPLYSSSNVEGNAVRVQFQYAEGGLKTRDGGPVKGFAVCGADRKWAWADAAIEGESVVVRNPQVAPPTAVRYAWGDNPVCNLVSAAGLPVAPFRTDPTP